LRLSRSPPHFDITDRGRQSQGRRRQVQGGRSTVITGLLKAQRF
jgi:hypothetical protein